MKLDDAYAEQVYAGVLGKIIGVYLGRPFEGWSNRRIEESLGEINYYVHEKVSKLLEKDVHLIVTDDDITGTFTFIRALEDHGNLKTITASQIGKSWLNYLIEEETILWWGGMGNSTEHTAYLSLKSGVEAPKSGSMELNGKVVAEQIGAQIFIDGWAMVVPGDPSHAASLAERAASVSHDGEAIYGAQIIAALESAAFVEKDVNKLLDIAVALIPSESVIYKMIAQIRQWHKTIPNWREAFSLLDTHYGYEIYGGNCHMIPNHGLIILALLYGDDDFQKSLMIVNTAGWDTDCNSGNLGCILGIKLGLAGINAGPDWRGPVADRVYLPSADGGRAISDAVIEAIHLVNMARALVGEPKMAPKDGARFHFEFPGAVQGFDSEESIEATGVSTLTNVLGSSLKGKRSLGIKCYGLAVGRVSRVQTPTFIPSIEIAEYFKGRGYALLASPTLYAGQKIKSRLVASELNKSSIRVCLYVKHYNLTDGFEILKSEEKEVKPGAELNFDWQVPQTDSQPIAWVGVEISSTSGTDATINLDYLTWSGAPTVNLGRPTGGPDGIERFKGNSKGLMWKRAWVSGFDGRERMTEIDFWPETFRLIQNVGRGIITQGTREWQDYAITAHVTPHMCQEGGIAVRVQGLERYYALIIQEEEIKLVRRLDGEDLTLANCPGGWTFGSTYELKLEVKNNSLVGFIDGKRVIEGSDPDMLFSGGGVGLLTSVGRVGVDGVSVEPVN